MITEQGIRSRLPRRLTVGQIYIYDEIGSTNTAAKEIAEDAASGTIGGAINGTAGGTTGGTAHGTIVIARTQTSGRGRYGRNFFSPPKSGLYISFILEPKNFNFELLDMATIFAAVCVCRAIESTCGKNPSIKWVNDIFLDGKKVCGILTESVPCLKAQSDKQIVIGIGINIQEPEGGFPENIRDRAAALYLSHETPASQTELAAALITEILSPAHSIDDILREYQKRLFIIGKEITVSGKDGGYTATAIGLTERGHLLVKKENGETAELMSGEVSINPI